MPIPRHPHAARLRACAVLLALAILAIAASSVQAAPSAASTAYGGGASPTGEEIAFGPYRSAGASWYGPGLWGRQTACGQTLRPRTLGVAHRSLPCGTAVKFVYKGRALVTQVIDRGPYARGRAWDLTAAASEALGFEGVGMVRYAIEVQYARP
jgi:rare lipoprotein A (peptidoglycan hydrolase)